MACHSAASAAYELLKMYVGNQALVVNVIDPTIDYLRENFAHQSVGVIGTRQTIASGVYAKKIAELNNNIELHQLATPLLAPLIEEGFIDHPALITVLQGYLGQSELKNITALLLGCTHYPLIKAQLQKFYGQHDRKVTLIDSAEITARAVKGLLEHHHLTNQNQKEAKQRFYVSDYTEAFIASARYFFPHTVHFEKYLLWQ